MKNFLIFVLLLVGFAVASCSSPPPDQKPSITKSEYVQASDVQINAALITAQDVTVLPAPDTPVPADAGNFLKNNWLSLVVGLMGFLKIVTNLTPTTKDNAIFGLLDTFFNMIVPNLKKGGGKFT